MNTRFSNTVQIKNRRASFEYEFIEKFIAGMVLKGTEIKSIREGKAGLAEAHCIIFKGEMYVRGMQISPYAQGTHYNHEDKRERKLLLSKREIEKLKKKMEEKGLTIIPLRLFITSRGFAKLEIALAKGKKIHDKRESLKAKDAQRDMDRLRER